MLYVHGATFPSGLSIAHRFDGFSWRDALNEAGFDVWGFDFQGFGHSDRYPEMSQPPEAHAPLCMAADAGAQVEAAARFVLAHSGAARLSLVSHSWGSMPTCRFAAKHPRDGRSRRAVRADRAPRPKRRYESPPAGPAWNASSP